VNLFVVGWGSGADVVEAGAALRRLLERLPFFRGRPVEHWSADNAAAAWVRHDELPYSAERGGSLALFSGRPFVWTDDDVADGRTPAAASFFLDRADLGEAVDGRFVSIVYRESERTLELTTDPVGAYPVYEATVSGTRWISNSAAALRQLTGDRGLRLDSLVGLLGGGWPLEGHPMWNGIERVQTGPSLRLAGIAGTGLDPDGAARRLKAATAALADWPGRPNVVPVTGGRDSRLVLAAALAAGLEFEGVTGGAPEEPDVRIGRELCAAAGVPHSLLPADPHGNMWSDHRRAAEVVRLTAGGTATLADAAGFPLGPREGPLPLWHSGQGGEIGRAYYGHGEARDAAGLTARLYDAFTARRPHRRELLSDAGREMVEGQLRAWVEAQLEQGVGAADIPDMFYVDQRMARWAAPTHGCVEYVRDTTSPLWSRRVIADLLSPAASERATATYHRRVLALLAPQLARVELAGGHRWDASPGRLEHARTLAGKAAREAARRVRGKRTPAAGAPTANPLDPILADVREQALGADSHPAWEVLDRERCEALLTRPATTLDEMSRYHVWRLATVFVE
jgi:hypothetical protein